VTHTHVKRKNSSQASIQGKKEGDVLPKKTRLRTGGGGKEKSEKKRRYLQGAVC